MTWLIVLVMITSLPAGYLLAHLCRDELVAGRNWFKLIFIISLILTAIFALLDNKLEIVLTLVYIAITSLVNLYLSYTENQNFLSHKILQFSDNKKLVGRK